MVWSDFVHEERLAKDGAYWQWGDVRWEGRPQGMSLRCAEERMGLRPRLHGGRLFAGKRVGGQNGVGLRGRAALEPPLREGREWGWGRSGRLRRQDSSTPLRSAQNDMGVERMNFGRHLHRGRLSTRAKRRRMWNNEWGRGTKWATTRSLFQQVPVPLSAAKGRDDRFVEPISTNAHP